MPALLSLRPLCFSQIHLLSPASVVLALSLAGCGSDSSEGLDTAATSGTATASGGTDSGGDDGTGGRDAGGARSEGSGGTVTGGASSGGAATAGADTGGRNAGGASTGGVGIGGTATGGTSVAGSAGATGGDSPGGASNAGSATGGAATGGAGGVLEGLRWLGRVDASDPAAVRLAWQGAGVVAIVEGADIEVQLRTEGTDVVYFQPVIDGVEANRFSVSSGGDRTVTLATGLAATEHVVELVRETEGMYGVSTFLGFTAGTVVGAPASNGRQIEVVGDSISAGYGNLGSEPHPNWVASPACHWTAENSSFYQTYGAFAGRALDAEVSTIARSGWGMVRDLDGNASGVLSAVYDHAVGTDDTTPWGFGLKASAVVINLGTNDQAPGDPGTPYEEAYLDFLTEVRSHYEDAWVFLAIGSMLSDTSRDTILGHLENVLDQRTAAGDDRVSILDLGVQELGSDGSVPTGCDWHPNVADHERMGAILVGELQARLGW